MAERLPPGTYDAESLKLPYLVNGLEPSSLHCGDSNGEHHSRSDSVASSCPPSQTGIDTDANGLVSHGDFGTYESNPFNQVQDVLTSNGGDDQSSVRFPKGSNLPVFNNCVSERADDRDPGPLQDTGNGSRSRNSAALGNDNQIEAEWIEQFEPGVYITLVALKDGTRDLKRVRFSRRRFGEHQAESWWSENRENVYKRYNVRGSDMSSATSHASRRGGREVGTAALSGVDAVVPHRRGGRRDGGSLGQRLGEVVGRIIGRAVSGGEGRPDLNELCVAGSVSDVTAMIVRHEQEQKP
nr:PH, RCC1 and FYVE domains-containing protein 1-like [Ipomoea batatas]GMC56398.1 PH, RCC1 and FYVE domains-containing protein 1-like [Ipomoea batatas]